MRGRILSCTLGLAFIMTGCSGSQAPHANDSDCGACGDCTGSIRFHGVVYLFDTRVNQTAPQGRALGRGAVVDCDHRTAIDSVEVSAVKHVGRSGAIRVGGGKWHGVYVAENLSHAEWPAVLRQR